MIWAPATSIPIVEKEEEEVFPEDVGLALPTVDVPLASLSEEERLALALKASIDIV